MPPTIPINHYLDPRNQQNKIVILFHYSMLQYSSKRLLWTLQFSHSKSPEPHAHSVKGTRGLREEERAQQYEPHGRPLGPIQNPTTSFLTATTLIYAIGAGITAAAGTRLALQLILDKGFRLFSFQLQGFEKSCFVIFCHHLPVSGLGNLRACCLP